MTLVAERTALLFPGQGSQALGMGRELAQTDPQAAQVFRRADELLGFPLSDLCWNGPADSLNNTLNTQPALLTHSLAVLRALQARLPDFRPAMAAGHSLGEVSALVAAEALHFDDALRLVRARGQAMQQAGARNPGGMAAVLGLDAGPVAEVCRAAAERVGGVVQVANDNCPGQVVISGDEAALAAAIEALGPAGARRVVRLAVSIAAHSPLMQPALEPFGRALQQADFRDPVLPVISNVHAAPLRGGEATRADLLEQLTARVRWTESVQAMAAAGIDTFLELGPGAVLTGLVRRIVPSARALALDGPDTLQAVAA